MTLSLRYAAHSEIGLVRKNNQDSAYVSPRMLVVADGMGGAAAGDLASAVAVHALADAEADLDALVNLPSQSQAAETTEPGPGVPDMAVFTLLSEALQHANDELAALTAGDPALRGMGTTVCGFVLNGDSVTVANIGDSRAYLLRDGELRRITRDHSWVQTLVDEGRITEEEALEHPHRSLIMRVLNGNPKQRPDFDVLPLRPGDRLLLCSDGLCGLVTDTAISTKVGLDDREMAVASLVDLAHDAGGYDNITIILADVEEGEPGGEIAFYGSARTIEIPHLEHTQPLPPLDAAGAASAAAAPAAAPPGRRPRKRRPTTEEERYGLQTERSRLGARLLIGVLLPLLVLGGGVYGWYSYTQTRFYLGPNDATVAVYQGVPDRVFGYQLSHVVADDGVKVADLPPYYVEKVRGIIQVSDEAAGNQKLAELKALAARCVAQREARARATQAPEPATSPTITLTTPTASPLESEPATPTSSPSPSPTTTPSPPQPQTPEDC